MGYKEKCAESDWNIYNVIQSCCKKKCCRTKLHPKQTPLPFTGWICETKPCFETWSCCDSRACRESWPSCDAPNSDSKKDVKVELQKDDECESLFSFCFDTR